MVIYMTTNLINGKCYIGQDSNNNPNYLGSGLNLKRAINKYGIDNFKKEIIEFCETKPQLNEREIYWIKEYNTITYGYNIAVGGGGGDTYNGLSEENKSINRKLKSKIAKEKNIMNHKTVYDCWVDSYGEDVAKHKLEVLKKKHSEISSKRFTKKLNRVREEYGDHILESFKDNTIDEIHFKLKGITSKKIIRLILKENGINTLSRKGINNGVNNGQSKLNCTQVNEIRNLNGKMTYKKIGLQYNISASQVGCIIRGESYLHCPYEPHHTQGTKTLKERK